MSSYNVLFTTEDGNTFFIEANGIFCDCCGCSCYDGIEKDGVVICQSCACMAQDFSSVRRRLFARKTGIKLDPSAQVPKKHIGRWFDLLSHYSGLNASELLALM